MKRNWVDDREIESLAMANCLMILTRFGGSSSRSGMVFRCKTCNKRFPSFQALGGHRRSHKKLINSVDDESRLKAKTYECSFCGLKFELGQALGGHMRLHRDSQPKKNAPATVPPADDSSRGLCLDLNLTPFQNQLKFWSRTGTTRFAL